MRPGGPLLGRTSSVTSLRRGRPYAGMQPVVRSDPVRQLHPAGSRNGTQGLAAGHRQSLAIFSDSVGTDGRAPALDQVRTWIRDLRGEFAYVLISAPPVGLYGDAALLGQTADGVVLVLEANSTRRVAALKSQAATGRRQGPVARDSTKQSYLSHTGKDLSLLVTLDDAFCWEMFVLAKFRSLPLSWTH